MAAGKGPTILEAKTVRDCFAGEHGFIDKGTKVTDKKLAARLVSAGKAVPTKTQNPRIGTTTDDAEELVARRGRR